MSYKDIDTLSEATNALLNDGFKENFSAEKNFIVGANSKKKYRADELKIVHSFRFDGMTNPADESHVFAIEANDGSKGVLVMSYSAEHSQNIELIKQIPMVENEN